MRIPSVFIAAILLISLVIPSLAVTQFDLTNGTTSIVIFNGTAGTKDWTVPAGVASINYLVVAGGGSAGNDTDTDGDGGGGAGGYLESTLAVSAGDIYNITVGSGGALPLTVGGGVNGTNSSIGTAVVAWGGGGGGVYTLGSTTNKAKIGGSGGGGGYTRTGAANITGNGFGGGAGQTSGVPYRGGGGGGAAAIGATGAGGTAPAGGAGKSSIISGIQATYSGGGGGGAATTGVPGLGGSGIGGNGGNATSCPTSGGTNTGGGGGGGAGNITCRGGNGGSGIVIISYAGMSAPVASFSCTPTSQTIGSAISCTDASTGSPTNWTYYWNDGVPGNVTDGTQNPSYTYPFIGTYSVNLTVNNTAGGSWFNRSNYITIHNATGLSPQDIWMASAYTTTLTVKDKDTGAPIANATIVDGSGQTTYTSASGTATLVGDFGVLVVYTSATGYYSAVSSYVVDSDESYTITLTKTSPTTVPNTNTIYSPWQVRIRIEDYYSNPIPGTNVTASYIATTLPSSDVSWLTSAFGITSSVAGDMLNSSVAMAGQTDSNGGLSFTMFKSIEYNLLIANTTSGISSTKQLYPSDQEYVIHVALPGQANVNNTLAQMNGTGLPVYMFNTSCYNLSMKYVDTSGLTSNVRFQVKFRGNGTTLLDRDEGAPGTTMIADNYTICKYNGFTTGDEVLWMFNATRSGI